MSKSKIVPIIIGGIAIYLLSGQNSNAITITNSTWYSTISKYSNRYGIPKSFIYAIITVESRGNPSASESGYWGGQGAMQISLPTARSLGFNGSKSQLFEPDNNIHYATAYLSELKTHFRGNVRDMAAGYNAGMDLKPYPYTYVDNVIKYYDYYAPKLGERARGFI